jgi:hypothetical protein
VNAVLRNGVSAEDGIVFRYVYLACGCLYGILVIRSRNTKDSCGLLHSLSYQ